MPELPEVETMRRGIAAVVGAKITGVQRTECKKKPIQIAPAMGCFRRQVVGATITEVGRVGKRVVLVLDRQKSIVIEPRMTGLVLLADPPNREHLRFRVELQGAVTELLYWDRRGLGTIRLYSADEFAARFGIEQIGPDALTVDWRLMRERLAASRRDIKVALLDQRAVAGIGNLYASELLHLARVHPQKRCQDITAAEWKRIHAATMDVLEAAILHEGSTLSDGTYRNALNQSGGYQNYHRVYDREGQDCTQCGRGKIRRTVQAQRATFFCPVCQRAPRSTTPKR